MIKILAYGDIHHHEYTNGIEEQDVFNVEQYIKSCVYSLDIDIVVFTGDRFQSRNPTDYVKYMADKCMVDLAKTGKPIICLVGNHDRSTKNNESHHSLASVGLFEYPNVRIVDTAQVLPYKINGHKIEFYCLPSGHVKTQTIINNLKREPDVIKICLFHDMITGCVTSAGTIFEGDNELVKIFKDNEFDLVIGGDNHRSQYMRFMPSETPLIYAGAPMQHTKNDGLWPLSSTFPVVTIHGDIDNIATYNKPYCLRIGWSPSLAAKSINISLYKTNAPRFMQIKVYADSVKDLIDILKVIGQSQIHVATPVKSGYFNTVAPLFVDSVSTHQMFYHTDHSIVYLDLKTSSDAFDGLIPDLEKKAAEILRARLVNLVVQTVVTSSEPIKAKRDSDADLWRAFVRDRGYDNAEELIAVGMDYIDDKPTED